MNMNRRNACRALAAGLVLPAWGTARAQAEATWTHPIRLVVPYPPGGFTDIVGRLLADKLASRLGQSIVVDNRGGGGGTIGTQFVVKAPPDGHTLLVVANDLAINDTLMAGRIPYNARTDLAPVSQVAWSPIVLVVDPAFQARSVGQLVAMAKAQPNTVNIGTGGNGTGAHLTLELLKSRTGAPINHIAYRGNGPALNDMLGRQISGLFVQYAVARPHIAAGTLRVLATASGARLPVLPDVPTIAESQLPGFNVEPWFGVVAPARTPAPLLARLSNEIAQVVQLPEVSQRFAELGAQGRTNSPAAFAQLIDTEIRDWAELIRKQGIKLE